MDITFRRLLPSDTEPLVRFLTGEGRPFHSVSEVADDTPLFDLRLRSGHRGRGIGHAAVTWLTRYLFEEFPHVHRIEGTTRQDNHPMRRVLLRCGYAEEAHYRGQVRCRRLSVASWGNRGCATPS
ncbi:GNAT family N-acetyltransferase [Streptomyces cyslabdanicus]|uniref:GNAT family N-acetyltransferase n=1 Tax=Streptomyces cyslabdanicus TaxID=1470456 RepID=UPI004044CA22